jgi:hypothetical protein
LQIPARSADARRFRRLIKYLHSNGVHLRKQLDKDSAGGKERADSEADGSAAVRGARLFAGDGDSAQGHQT